ncbi:hypothetical protein H4R33_004008 [Dimargaris cristalligena]|uniref:Pyridoxamine 5'-phosphate oxidase-domain-containing protein n=1 Tax=Dimargaris cristalligena TaxID=215637 RepID=A0A4P9ZX27_9FUNG|nr:hypothetical protein H4R33_004008 [Dimargaris cristalligena]RKP37432.1 pyridoxamine 5'-phosphate oxidase-domain-containing protein [Dimargaris cristalligena]|eukprot:RKP37432.1 pyridoxamine 5'-phosphate oxidase-domain-containing protein [Dimargaris cristalligena]
MPRTNTLPAWKTLLQASLTKNIELAAQPDTSGQPANRTVVFRGFAGEKPQHPALASFIDAQVITNLTEKNSQRPSLSALGQYQSELLVFTAHLKSEKISEIQKSPTSELCWFMPHTNEQYRLKGQMYLITSPTYYGQNVAAEQKYRAVDDFLRQFCHPITGSDGSSPTMATASPTAAPLNWELLRLNHYFHMPAELRASFTWDYAGQCVDLIPKQERPNAHLQVQQCTRLGDIPTQPAPTTNDPATDLASTLTITPGLDTASVEYRRTQHALQNFVLLLLKVDQVDRCQLGSWPAQRTFYVRRERIHQLPGHRFRGAAELEASGASTTPAAPGQTPPIEDSATGSSVNSPAIGIANTTTATTATACILGENSVLVPEITDPASTYPDVTPTVNLPPVEQTDPEWLVLDVIA